MTISGLERHLISDLDIDMVLADLAHDLPDLLGAAFLLAVIADGVAHHPALQEHMLAALGQ